MSAPEPLEVLVDLGRSHIRVVAPGVDERRDGGAGLGDAGGPEAASRLVAAAVRAACPAAVGRLAVCAPGVATDAAAAQAFADALARDTDTASDGHVLVASDAAAWQVGAFAGGDGAVIALGTGAAVVARDRGIVTRLDGLGLLLGDVGGGAWIGLEAMRRAARADGGPVHAAAVAQFGPAAGWSRLLGAADLAPRLAALVPDVAAAAEAADPTAAAVLDAATDGILATLDPLRPELPHCVVGGLAPVLAPRLAAVAPARLWTEPRGDVTDGLRLLLADAGPYVDETYRAGSR